MTDQAYRQVSDRGPIGKFAKMLFILVNILMVLILLSEIATLKSVESSFDIAGAALKFGLLLLFWVPINLLLGTFVLLTRRKRFVPANDLLMLKRADREYRKQEAARGWAIALGAWIVFAAINGTWLTAAAGIAGAAIIAYLFFVRRWT